MILGLHSGGLASIKEPTVQIFLSRLPLPFIVVFYPMHIDEKQNPGATNADTLHQHVDTKATPIVLSPNTPIPQFF